MSRRTIVKIRALRAQIAGLCKGQGEMIYPLAMARVDIAVLKEQLREARESASKSADMVEAISGDLREEKTAHAATVDNWQLDTEGAAKTASDLRAENVRLSLMIEDRVAALATGERAHAVLRSEINEARKELASLKALAHVTGPSPVPVMRSDDRRNEKCPHGWPIVWVAADAPLTPGIVSNGQWVKRTVPECRSVACAEDGTLSLGPTPTVQR